MRAKRSVFFVVLGDSHQMWAPSGRVWLENKMMSQTCFVFVLLQLWFFVPLPRLAARKTTWTRMSRTATTLLPTYEDTARLAVGSVTDDFKRSSRHRQMLRTASTATLDGPFGAAGSVERGSGRGGLNDKLLDAPLEKTAQRSLRKNMYLEDTTSITAGRLQQVGLFTLSSVLTMGIAVCLEGMRRGHYAFGMMIPFAGGMSLRSWKLFEEVSADMRQLQATTEMRSMRKRTINFRAKRPGEEEDATGKAAATAAGAVDAGDDEGGTDGTTEGSSDQDA